MKINVYQYKDKDKRNIGVSKVGGNILRSYDSFGRMAIYDKFEEENSGIWKYVGTCKTKSRNWKKILEESELLVNSWLR
jgi:hypothetical protein